MKLYNTLTRQIEEIKPQHPPVMTVYTCGPTVYNNMTIGNIDALIYADTLGRTLRANGFETKHVMNFTDVDDKTIQRSRQKYPDLAHMEALQRVTDEYGAVALEDMESVNIDLPQINIVKATDNIAAMQELIRQLHGSGFAYITDSGVYFSIEAYKKSGKKYGQLAEITVNSTSAARIDNDEYDKASAHDFALWKSQKNSEPAWDFELDGQSIKGRPGWHIECSVMSTGNLGQPFDIHTGGTDLIFPHHENEIAQSTAGKDNPVYATVFMHNEHILVDGRKMSKSLNNFVTMKDVLERGSDPIAFRVLVLQAHYRSQLHFSWDNLEAAHNRLQDLRAMAVLRWQPRAFSHDSATFTLEDVPKELGRIMAEDLNSPGALAYLSDVATQLNAVHIESDMVDHFINMLAGIDDLLGLKLMDVPDISDAQKQLITDREAARQAKDWNKSDVIRQQLTEEGIGVRDLPHGPIWQWL